MPPGMGPDGNNRRAASAGHGRSCVRNRCGSVATSRDKHKAAAVSAVWRFHPNWEIGARTDWLRAAVAHEGHFLGDGFASTRHGCVEAEPHCKACVSVHDAARAVEFENPAKNCSATAIRHRLWSPWCAQLLMPLESFCSRLRERWTDRLSSPARPSGPRSLESCTSRHASCGDTSRQDPHHIEARPALIAQLRSADAAICTARRLRPAGYRAAAAGRQRQSAAGSQRDVLRSDCGQTYRCQARHGWQSVRRGRARGRNPHFHVDPHRIVQVLDAWSARLQQLFHHNRGDRTTPCRVKRQWSERIKEWERRAAPAKGRSVAAQHSPSLTSGSGLAWRK